MTTQNKSQLRKQFRTLRQNLTASQRDECAQELSQLLCAQAQYQKANHIGIYWATPEEVSLDVFITQARHDQKNLYLPVVNTEFESFSMSFHVWNAGDELRENRFNIPEPIALEQPQKNHSLDLILVPLVAYNYSGDRLGMGAGFYDRFFAQQLSKNTQQRKCSRIGVAHSIQQAKNIPTDKFDIKLNALVNEKEFITFENSD